MNETEIKAKQPNTEEPMTSNRNLVIQGMRSPLKPLGVQPCRHLDCLLLASKIRREEFLFFHVTKRMIIFTVATRP